jgi:hypothetical protein
LGTFTRISKSHPFMQLTNKGGAKPMEGADFPQWTKPGGVDQAFDDFMSLPGKSAKDVSKDGKITFTKDMGQLGKATMRDHSTTGAPTLELQEASGGSKIAAIRYPLSAIRYLE